MPDLALVRAFVMRMAPLQDDGIAQSKVPYRMRSTITAMPWLTRRRRSLQAHSGRQSAQAD